MWCTVKETRGHDMLFGACLIMRQVHGRTKIPTSIVTLSGV